MIRLGIAGACGRMGQRIAALAAADPESFTITGALEKDNSKWCGADYARFLGLSADRVHVKVESDATAVIDKVDVLVDFAVGDDVLTHVNLARQKKVKMVIGTTGLNKSGVTQINEAAREIPIVMDSNMSPGLNIILTFLPKFIKSLGSGYDIDIIDTHHRSKKDWPSGTALRLADVLAKAANRKIKSDGQPRTGSEVVIHSVRGGDVVGDHTLIFARQGERIEITHRASSRDIFAFGALWAAKFVARANAGKCYKMLDAMRGYPG